MNATYGLVDKSRFKVAFGTAIIAASIFFLTSYSLQIFSEHFNLIRSGMMVDESVCGFVEKGPEWSELETKYFRVYFQRDVDLSTVERRLNQDYFIFSIRSGRGNNAEEKIARRLDSIFSQATDILDMHPKITKLRVKVYKDSELLYQDYRKMTDRSEGEKAFYVHDCGMIYTSEDGISDSVMAHEIAHAIIDNYYQGIPPARISETLASYVDMHLSD